METSIHYRSFQQKCYQKDASFSSYLRPPPPPPKSPPPPSQEPNESTVDDSDQISVFDAENYFSESSSNNNNNNEHKENNKIASSSSSPAIFPPDQRSEFSIVSRLSSVSSDDRYRNGRNYRTHSFHATPTASSEASWNSRTGLLSNPPGSIAVSLKNLPPRDNLNINGERVSSAKKWFLGRKCPCSCKKSVEVKEKSSIVKTSESKKLQSNQSVIESEFKTVFTKQQSVKKSHLVESSEMLVPNLRRVSSQKCSMNDVIESSAKVDPNSRRFSSQGQFSANATVENRHHHHHHGRQFNEGAGFSFPILNQSSKIMLTGAQTCTPMEDPPRDSLEVFQPPEESASGKSMAVQHRALASPISRITAATDDDVASDASSDLFEIESLSTQPPLPPPSYPMFFRRDSLDEAATFNGRRLAAGGGVNFRQQSSDEAAATPSIAVAECYEPSEASIDWSVTTAEAFDRASVTNLSISASDIEEFATIQQVKSGGGGSGGGGDGSRRRLGNYGGLLSCRCEKAVNVGLPPRF
ncbi:hypothetical protein ACSBR1_035117 [Camellia fascicularis]